MLHRFLELLFGCWHANCSFPLTPRKGGARRQHPASQLTGTYVTCLDCGREFPYDWQRMRVVSRREQKRLFRFPNKQQKLAPPSVDSATLS